jgi:carbonic anhydrase
VSTVRHEVLAANARYAATFGDKANLPMPPARHVAILTCMDARMDPAKFAGLAEGDAHVIRNAGGRASDDAIRSLIISHKLQGTREWFVIHHTNCGQESFTDETIRVLLSQGSGSMDGEYIDWLAITNQRGSVVADVQRLRNHRLVPSSIAIYGYIFDVKTGRLEEVQEATAIGRPA